MCWCAGSGLGLTMAGLIGPLADWFEMASLGSSPWGAPLSFSWFPLFTNSKQKSISFSRGFGRRGEISRPCSSASREVTLKESSFLPSPSKFLNGWLNSFRFPFCPPSLSLRARSSSWDGEVLSPAGQERACRPVCGEEPRHLLRVLAAPSRGAHSH